MDTLGDRARAVAATGRSWHGVLGACLDQLDPLPADANLGVIYCSEALAPVADELVRALRARTGVPSWVGSCGSAVLGAAGREGLAVLLLALPAGGFRVRAGLSGAASGGVLIAHAELAEGGPGSVLTELAAAGASRTSGGLIAAGRQPIQIADGVLGGGAACLDFAPGQPVVAGIATAGSPLGMSHRITSALNGEILSLDGRPALAVMT